MPETPRKNTAYRYDITIDIDHYREINTYIDALNAQLQASPGEFDGITFFEKIDERVINFLYHSPQAEKKKEELRGIKYQAEYEHAKRLSKEKGFPYLFEWYEYKDFRNPFTGVRIIADFELNDSGIFYPKSYEYGFLADDTITNNTFILTQVVDGSEKPGTNIASVMGMPLEYVVSPGKERTPEEVSEILQSYIDQYYLRDPEQESSQPRSQESNPPHNLTPEGDTDFSRYKEGGVMGVTPEDAELQLKIINDTFALFTEYHHHFGKNNLLNSYFGIDPDNSRKLTVQYDRLSPILRAINELQAKGLVKPQKANDFRDLLNGYTAAIVSTKTIWVDYTTEREGATFTAAYRGNDYDTPEGGDVVIPVKTNEHGEIVSAEEGFSLMELSAHELLGHGVGYTYKIPGHRAVEAIKYEAIIRRLEGRRARDWEKSPHIADSRMYAEYDAKLDTLKTALTKARESGEEEDEKKLKNDIEALRKLMSAEYDRDYKANMRMQDISHWNDIGLPPSIENWPYGWKLENWEKTPIELPNIPWSRPLISDISDNYDNNKYWKRVEEAAAKTQGKPSQESTMPIEDIYISLGGSPRERKKLARRREKERKAAIKAAEKAAKQQRDTSSLENLSPQAFPFEAPASAVRSMEETLSAQADTGSTIPPIRIDNRINIVKNITGNIDPSLVTRKLVEELLVEMLSTAEKTAG